MRDTPTSTLNLEVRTRNWLISGGFTSLGKIIDASDADLLRIPNFGKKSLKETRDLMAGYIASEQTEPVGEDAEFIRWCFRNRLILDRLRKGLR